MKKKYNTFKKVYNGSTGITDKWGFRHTCYVATAAQNLNDFRNSNLWTCSHIMVILRSQNKNTEFLTISASLCGFILMNEQTLEGTMDEKNTHVL